MQFHNHRIQRDQGIPLALLRGEVLEVLTLEAPDVLRSFVYALERPENTNGADQGTTTNKQRNTNKNEYEFWGI